MTIAELLREAATRLKPREGMFFPGREARMYLAKLLKKSEAFVLAYPHFPVDEACCQAFRAFLQRRQAGEPFHLILGSCPFYGREFLVRPGVLIPRPETELLVQAALALPLPSSPLVLDVGTGSGCLAVTLALELPRARVVASDLSWEALALAKANAVRWRAQVQFCLGDLGSHLRGPFQLVVANLPYLPESYRSQAPPELAFEPATALYAGSDGLALLKPFLAQLPRLMDEGGFALLEVGPEQAEKLILQLAQELCPVEVVADTAGVLRVLALQRSPSLPLGPALGLLQSPEAGSR